MPAKPKKKGRKTVNTAPVQARDAATRKAAILASITPRGLSEHDVAAYVGLSVHFLRAARAGRGDGPPYIRIGSSVRYLLEDVNAWLDGLPRETKKRA